MNDKDDIGLDEIKNDLEVILPDDIRSIFGNELLSVKGPNNRVYLYTPDQFNSLNKRIENGKRFGVMYPEFRRNISSGIFKNTIDANNKIILNAVLNEHLGPLGNKINYHIDPRWIALYRKHKNMCGCDDYQCSKCRVCKNPYCSTHRNRAIQDFNHNVSSPIKNIAPSKITELKEKFIEVMNESEKIRENWKYRTARTRNYFVIEIPPKFQHWFGIDSVTVLGLEGSIIVIRRYKYERMIKDCEDSWKEQYKGYKDDIVHSMFDVGIKSPIDNEGLLVLPSDWIGLETTQRVPSLFFIDGGSGLFIFKGHKGCKCSDPECAECLVIKCEDPFCLTHDLEDKINRRECLKIDVKILKNYLMIRNKINKDIEEYKEDGYFEVLGESLPVKHYPNLYKMYTNSKSNLEAQLKSIADTWHEGSVVSASQAFESDLQHG